VLVALALLLAQAPAPQQSLGKLTLHELVKEIPRFVDVSWALRHETERPPSIRAEDELRERIRMGAVLDLADWETILVEKGYLRWRSHWPKGKPFAVHLFVPELPVRVILAPGIPGGKLADSSFGGSPCPVGDPLEWSLGYQELGVLAADQSRVRFDVRPYYVTGTAAALATQRVLSVGTITVDVEQVAQVDEVVAPISNPALDRVLTEGLSIQSAAQGPWIFLSELEWPSDLACSLEVTLLREGRCIDALELFRRGTVQGLPLKHLPRAIVSGAESSKGWSIRLRGTSKRVLMKWNATRYWAGEIEVPLADLTRR